MRTGDSRGHRYRLPCPKPLPFLVLVDDERRAARGAIAQLITPWPRHRDATRADAQRLHLAQGGLSDHQLVELARIQA